MLTYMGTSVLIAVLTGEACAPSILIWRREQSPELISGDWCITEFASALALKVRTRQLTQEQSAKAWAAFTLLTESGMLLLPLGREIFTDAALLVRESDSGLRAGDALHLALALQAEAQAIATLDNVQKQHALVLGLQAVQFSI